jgi:hypothetical protein
MNESNLSQSASRHNVLRGGKASGAISLFPFGDSVANMRQFQNRSDLKMIGLSVR